MKSIIPFARPRHQAKVRYEYLCGGILEHPKDILGHRGIYAYTTDVRGYLRDIPTHIGSINEILSKYSVLCKGIRNLPIATRSSKQIWLLHLFRFYAFVYSFSIRFLFLYCQVIRSISSSSLLASIITYPLPILTVAICCDSSHPSAIVYSSDFFSIFLQIHILYSTYILFDSSLCSLANGIFFSPSFSRHCLFLLLLLISISNTAYPHFNCFLKHFTLDTCFSLSF